MIKLFATVFILTGCGYLGILFAMSYKKRVRQLIEFQQVLNLLEFDINFLAVPLKESFEKISKNSGGGVKDVIDYIRERIEKDKCIDMQRLWERGFQRFSDEIFLTQEDKKILLDFSKNLGCGDRESEINNIKITLSRLKIAENEAREIAKTNVKMYRGLGFLTGFFIVIILI
ncbi:MAG: hypothetical protein J6D15_02100 [Clostridia bacterium]|nr:hypothetical protein [Clostridia bacterium]